MTDTHMNALSPPHARPPRMLRITALLGAASAVAGCVGPFDNRDFITLEPTDAELHDIDRIRLLEQSRSAPVTVDEATEAALERGLVRPEPPSTMTISLEEARAAALANNLDLKVALVAPAIAQASVDREEAKFEATFRGSFLRSRTDSPSAVATEGSRVDFTRYEVGVDLPLRTGGSISLNLPTSKLETDNPFSLLDPSYTADLAFSISQPLLRGAGNYTNTHSIRVSKYQSSITQAQTKLESIRIIANVDRVYWRLYAARRERDVAYQNLELAQEQLERARHRVAAGVDPDIEVIRARSGVAQRLQSIIITENLVRQRQRDLKRIMQRDDLPMESPTELIPTTVPDPLSLDLESAELAEYAVENRMEMLELELQLAIDSSSIDFARNAALPLFMVDYTYNISGLDKSYRRAWGHIPDHSFEDWSVRLSAEIPIGNEARRSDIHRAILQRVQRLATRDLRETAIRQEVYDVLDTLRQNWQRILAARLDTVMATQTYEGEVRQFEVGARTSTDVLDAASRLAEARFREITALVDYQISQVDIAVATGTLLGFGRIRWEGTDIPGSEYE